MTHTHKMAMIAILSAISFLLMYFQIPLIPGADFLQMELSILPILVGLVLLDFKSSLVILLLRSFLKLVLNSAGISTLIGLPMNVMAVSLFVASFALIWKNKPTLRTFIWASISATIGLTVVMLVANYVYAVPMYAAFAHFDIKAILGLGNYLFAMVMPFNLIQGTVFSLAFLSYTV